METRTRFAPSPTGFMHIGNLRTALYTYLLAKKNKGKFILRIEDTDQERFVEGSVELIYKTMQIAGLKNDEGPDVGGEFGPYIQSQRKDIYLKHAKELVQKKGAYYCFCSKDRLEVLRQKAEEEKRPFKYDGFCKKLSESEVEKKLADNEEYVIRQNIPAGREMSFIDLVYGEIKANTNDLDEGVLMKTGGLPTYNFANVIDDHLMQISHVIRGSEYLSSTPKYLLLYEAFGWQAPEHIHLSMILKNSSQKFSKRDGDASFIDLLARGFLPEAIVNYLALLGWSPKSDREIFSLKELEEAFDISGIHKSPAIFDIVKLEWMNSEYLKKMDPNDFHDLCRPYYEELSKKENLNLKALSAILQTRINKLSEIAEKTDFFIKLPEYDISLFENAKMRSDRSLAFDVIKAAIEDLQEIEDWTEENIKACLLAIVQNKGLKNGQVLWPLRIALSGKEFTPGGAFEIAHILGREEAIERLKKAEERLVDAGKL
jgi:glutamyl-tRNA synthetase